MKPQSYFMGRLVYSIMLDLVYIKNNTVELKNIFREECKMIQRKIFSVWNGDNQVKEVCALTGQIAIIPWSNKGFLSWTQIITESR